MTSIIVQFISMMALSLTLNYFYKGARAIVKYTLPRHTCTYHKNETTGILFYIWRE